MPHPFLLFVVLQAICQVVNLFGRLSAAKFAGTKVVEVSLFVGPTLLQFRLKDTAWKINLLPFGNHVRFVEDEKDHHRILELPLGKRLLLYASGCLALAVLVCICLGPRHGILSIWRGCNQLLEGAYSPATVGRTLIRGLYSIIRHDPFITGLGVVAAKTISVNLLPIPPLDGGHFLFALLERITRVSEKAREVVTTAGIFFCMIFMGSWLFALVSEATHA